MRYSMHRAGLQVVAWIGDAPQAHVTLALTVPSMVADCHRDAAECRAGRRWVRRTSRCTWADSTASNPFTPYRESCTIFCTLRLPTFGLSCCAEASWPSRSSSDTSSIVRWRNSTAGYVEAPDCPMLRFDVSLAG